MADKGTVLKKGLAETGSSVTLKLLQPRGDMMNLAGLYRLRGEIEHRFPSLGKWQAKGLALACWGLILQEQCQISRMAEALPEWGAFNTVRQRLKRWLNNPRMHVTNACYEWIAWVWSSCHFQRPVLLVDETKLGERLAVMMVSLAFEGRAIPLLWRCYYANSALDYPQQGQVLLIYGLLAQVLSALPRQVRPLIQMDRGLAHSSAMLWALKALKVDFLVRVKATARFTSRRGHSQLLSQMVKPGETTWAQGTLFTREHQITGRVYLIWERSQTEAWCLFSNAAGLGGHRYALRWWQEESFKDLKSGGWQWHTSHIRCPRRMERLLLVMAVSYGWMLSLGALLGEAPAQVQRQVATRDGLQTTSLFRLGLRWFKRLLHCTPAALQVTLWFAPPAFRCALE
jgi:hypothetical protein